MTPDGWTRSQLAAFCTEVNDRRGSRAEPTVLSVSKDYGIIPQAQKFKKRIASKETAHYKIVRRGDFVFDPMLLWSGSIARQRAVDEGIVSPAYSVFRATNVCADFLEYLLRDASLLPTYARISRGTNVRRKKVLFEDFVGLSFAWPPLPEQKKIAAILTAVDDVIQKTQAVIDQLQVVKQAMMEELLTRGIPGRHAEYARSSFGMIPKSWRVCRLDQYADVRTGIAKNKSSNTVGARPLPYLRVANVQDGYLDLSEMKTIPVDSAAVERYQLRDGDVLFTEGGDADKLGRGCVWRGQIELCLHQNHVFAVRCDSSVLRPDFLAYCAASVTGRSYFVACSKQTTNLASINSSQLRAFPVPLPSIEEQDEIVATLQSLDATRAAEVALLSNWRFFKSALSSVLLSGQTRVRIEMAV